MVARIKGFVTRRQAGLRAPRSVSYNITPQHGGAAIHWGGTRQNTGSHARCTDIWRSWQNFHMNTHGWADIAYTLGFCNHGYVYAGRGLGVRTAANGTNSGNQNYHAFVWIGGQGDTQPNQDAINALEWCILEARRAGNAGRRVRPHTDFTGSTCPGPQLTPHTRRLDNANISTDTPTPQDPWEEFMSTLNNKQKENLTKLANMSDARLKAVMDLAEGVDVNGTNGKSFITQLLKRHREDIPRLTDWVDRFDSLVEQGKTSIQGVVIGGVNVIDAVRDMGYKITTRERTGATKE